MLESQSLQNYKHIKSVPSADASLRVLTDRVGRQLKMLVRGGMLPLNDTESRWRRDNIVEMKRAANKRNLLRRRARHGAVDGDAGGAGDAPMAPPPNAADLPDEELADPAVLGALYEYAVCPVCGVAPETADHFIAGCAAGDAREAFREMCERATHVLAGSDAPQLTSLWEAMTRSALHPGAMERARANCAWLILGAAPLYGRLRPERGDGDSEKEFADRMTELEQTCKREYERVATELDSVARSYLRVRWRQRRNGAAANARNRRASDVDAIAPLPSWRRVTVLADAARSARLAQAGLLGPIERAQSSFCSGVIRDSSNSSACSRSARRAVRPQAAGVRGVGSARAEVPTHPKAHGKRPMLSSP